MNMSTTLSSLFVPLYKLHAPSLTENSPDKGASELQLTKSNGKWLISSSTSQQYLKFNPSKITLMSLSPQTCSSSSITVQVLMQTRSSGIVLDTLRKCCTMYHPFHHCNYLCPLLSISIITILAQNSFTTHPAPQQWSPPSMLVYTLHLQAAARGTFSESKYDHVIPTST